MSDRAPLTEPVIFRRIFLGLYGLLVFGFFASVAVSGTYGAFFVPAEPVEVLPTARGGDCKQDLAALLAELEQRGQALMLDAHDPTAEAGWKTFSDRFRARLESLRVRCDAESPAHAELADHLERHRLGYETALRSLRQIAGPSRAALVNHLRERPTPARP